MRDLSPVKIVTVAWREFRTTALTPAFIFSAVVVPIIVWAAMIVVGAMNFERPPLKGTLAVIDTTRDQVIARDLIERFDLEKARARALAEAQLLTEQATKKMKETVPGAHDAQVQAGVKTVQQMTGIGLPVEVVVEVLGPEANEQRQRDRARDDEILALVKVDEGALDLPGAADAGATDSDAGAPSSDADGSFAPPTEHPLLAAAAPGSYKFVQGSKLRPEHAEQLRGAVRSAIEDERFRRAGIDPAQVLAIQSAGVQADTVVVTDDGEKKANDGLVSALPVIFMVLLYMSAVTGGNYLMMGTLEEKSSRVMEVILSACSARELLIGKLVGQGLVGLAMLCVYTGLGMLVANQFSMLGAIPMGVLPWFIVYFLIAYALLGSMMLAVGAAVTEIREAQALFTPITVTIILPFLLIGPVMQNPGSVLARVASFFPLTTPYAMIMRLSQPSHVVPVWELIATTVVGFAGVLVLVWAAAKIFRVGVLMYGKPPSLLGLIKWLRYA